MAPHRPRLGDRPEQRVRDDRYRAPREGVDGAAAFERKSPKKERREAERIQVLEAKLRKKDEVISELMEDHVKLKKELGDL